MGKTETDTVAINNVQDTQQSGCNLERDNFLVKKVQILSSHTHLYQCDTI